tara:strand:- start:1108 stop:1359 length:252 start_codon:yes stop_codon:yes gene_type:complete
MDNDLEAVANWMEEIDSKMREIDLELNLRTITNFNNALLNIAVNRFVAIEGCQGSATILWRLADALSNGAYGSDPVEITHLNG